jgi:nitrous oxide reductase accessory protein NosL
MKKTLLLSLIAMILLAACKKDKKETPISLKGNGMLNPQQ